MVVGAEHAHPTAEPCPCPQEALLASPLPGLCVRRPPGGPLGSGKQWMSWIHRDDLVGLIVSALTDPTYSGVFNATAPRPVRMSELCSALGERAGAASGALSGQLEG